MLEESIGSPRTGVIKRTDFQFSTGADLSFSFESNLDSLEEQSVFLITGSSLQPWSLILLKNETEFFLQHFSSVIFGFHCRGVDQLNMGHSGVISYSLRLMDLSFKF